MCNAYLFDLSRARAYPSEYSRAGLRHGRARSRTAARESSLLFNTRAKLSLSLASEGLNRPLRPFLRDR